MKYRLLSLLAIASLSNSSRAIAQTYPDITGRWMLKSISNGYEQIIEFENSSTGLQVWQDAPSFPVANDVTRSGNRIESSWFCRGYCYMEGQINEDGLSGILEVSARDERGNPLPDRQPFAYRLTKITDEYCSVTGVWNYYSESDFIYNSNSGFSEGGPPYRARVNITEDKDRNIIISGFYNMSSGDGTVTEG